MKVYLGIDVGSVATKMAVLDSRSDLVIHSYRPTQGDPIGTVQQGLRQIRQCLPRDAKISGVATTGSFLAHWGGRCDLWEKVKLRGSRCG